LLQQNKNKKKGTVVSRPLLRCKKKKKAMATSPSSSSCYNKTKKSRWRKQVVAFFTTLHQKIKLKEGKKAYFEAWKWKLRLLHSRSHSDSGAPALALAMAITGRRGEVGGR
jgi:hypothetical protein